MKVVIDKVINRTTYKVSWSVFNKNNRYGKYQKVFRSRTVHFDGQQVALKEGDRVSIFPCRPISKMKKWEIKELLN